LRLFCVYTFC